jgi:hypothetical protein
MVHVTHSAVSTMTPSHLTFFAVGFIVSAAIAVSAIPIVRRVEIELEIQ